MWVDVARAVGGDSCGRRLASRGGSGFCKNNSAVCEVGIGLLHNKRLLCVGFDLMLQLTVSRFTDQSFNVITSVL